MKRSTHMDIQSKVSELNRLYHRLITNCFDLPDKEEFGNLVTAIKAGGYRFRLGVPSIDFKLFELNDYEAKLFIRYEIIRLLKVDAIEEKLTWFSVELRDCEYLLSRLIYVSLCSREVLDKHYFILREKKRIDFMQSGNAVDLYILWDS